MAKTDWPPCEVCGKPVTTSQGMLVFSYDELREYEAQRERWELDHPEGEAILLPDPTMPKRVHWHWGHRRCVPDGVYSIDASRFDSTEQALSWTLHLMMAKRWILDTAWAATVRRFHFHRVTPVNEALKDTQPEVIIFGKIARDRKNPSRVGIVVVRKGEYGKSPLSGRIRTARPGDRVVVVHDAEQCEASLHNLPELHGFWIGTARIRLENPQCTEEFYKFMGKAKLTQGTVKLIFVRYDTEYRVRVSKA